MKEIPLKASVEGVGEVTWAQLQETIKWGKRRKGEEGDGGVQQGEGECSMPPNR